MIPSREIAVYLFQCQSQLVQLILAYPLCRLEMYRIEHLANAGQQPSALGGEGNNFDPSVNRMRGTKRKTARLEGVDLADNRRMRCGQLTRQLHQRTGSEPVERGDHVNILCAKVQLTGMFLECLAVVGSHSKRPESNTCLTDFFTQSITLQRSGTNVSALFMFGRTYFERIG